MTFETYLNPKNQCYLAIYVVFLLFVLSSPSIAQEYYFETTGPSSFPSEKLKALLEKTKLVSVKYSPRTTTAHSKRNKSFVEKNWRYEFGVNCPVRCDVYFQELLIAMKEDTYEMDRKCPDSGFSIVIEFVSSALRVLDKIYIHNSGRCFEFESLGKGYIFWGGFDKYLHGLWQKTAPPKVSVPIIEE